MKEKIISMAVLIFFLIEGLIFLSGCEYQDNYNNALIGNMGNNENITDNKLIQNDTEITTDSKEKNIVVIGNYANQPIEWILLEDTGTEKLLITKYVIDYKPYNEGTVAKGTYWKDSSIRKWLNDEFMDLAFTEKEKNFIVLSEVQDYKEEKKIGDITKDKIFLLSSYQVNNYFDNASASYTAYAKSKDKYGSNSWWLIDSYISSLYKQCINDKGIVQNSPRVNENEGIRPAMWVKSEIGT